MIERIERNLSLKKPLILCIDFDGVLHSYINGWQGARRISDPPVPGAIDWLRSLLSDTECVCAMAPRYLEFDVQIYSSRSKYFGGRRAIKKWLEKEFEKSGYYKQLVELIKFPSKKPSAHLFIDDRAFTFKGKFPSVEEMKKFKPWNKKREYLKRLQKDKNDKN